jgi:hypothetical protein
VVGGAFLLLIALAGCARQHLITGEPLILGLDSKTGAVVDRDLVPASTPVRDGDPTSPSTIPHKGEIIAIVVNSVFIRYLAALTSPHVLVYAEVFDDGQDDPATAVTKLLFNEQDQPSGVHLGMADRVIYGPTPYKGFPIRIKFNIIELDKEDKQTASRLLNAAGTIVSAAQPQAAPASGVIVQVAELINALNKDDFELRFDLTLYPVERNGVSDIGDEALTKPKQDEQGKQRKPEPIQRHGKPYASVSTLRTGSYVVIKRELAERVREREGAVPSHVLYDWTQEAFVNNYMATDGRTVQAEELLRLQGGYLYRVTRKLNGLEGTNSVTVRLQSGPNRNVEFSLVPGVRQLFTDQTYVALTILNGLQMGLDQESLRASSKRDVETISKLLDNPGQVPFSETIGPRIDDLAALVKTALEQRRIAETAARRVGRDPQFRTSPEYPRFWSSQIEPLTGLANNSTERRNAVAKNAAILPILSDLVLNLPTLSPEDGGQMAALQKLGAEAFETIPDRPGLFRLSAKLPEKSAVAKL